jgi:flagellin-like protein
MTREDSPPVEAADDSAVSPVIATILMVAITVVVAATVFVISQQLGVGTDQPATLAFRTEDAQDRVKVISTSSDVDWADIQVRLSDDGEWSLNGGVAVEAEAGEWLQAGTGPVYAGHSFDLCLATPGPGVFEVRYQDPGLGITRLTLVDIGAC